MVKLIFKSAVIVFMLMIFSTPALAKEVVNVDINATTYVNVGMTITRITSGKTTTILAWTIDGQIREYMIVVSPEDEGQALLIQRAIGLPNVHVKKIGQKILLTGTVKNQYERNLAIQVASFYLNGNPHVSLSTGSNVYATSNSSDDIEPSEIENNGLTNPTQIKFEAQVIDINSSDAKDLGFQYGADSGSGAAISIAPNYGQRRSQQQSSQVV